MYFLVTALDKPGRLDLRLATRPAHLDYIRAAYDDVKIVFGSPLAQDDEKTMKGTFIVLQAPSRERAEDFSYNDPYYKAGLFERHEIIALHEVFEAERWLKPQPS